MLKTLDRCYKRFVLVGLAMTVWFATFAHAAYDLWAASAVFFWLTLLFSVFCLGRCRDKISVKLPLAGPTLLFLASLILSCRHSYDLDTSKLEIWVWFFTFLSFYLLINSAENEGDLSLFFTLAGMVILPLSVICAWERLTVQPDTWGRWAIHATLISSIILAGFTLYWPLFFWYKTLENRRYLILLLPCVAVLLIVQSWWAFASIALGILLTYREPIAQLEVRHRKTTFMAIVTTLSILGWLGSYKLRTHVGPYIGVSRFFYWLSALRMWRQNAWTGVGVGGYSTAFPFFKAGQIQSTLFAHSFPLELLSETGIVGVLAAILFAWSYLKLTAKTRSSAKTGPQTRVYFMTLVVVLFFSVLSFNMEYLLNKFMLLMMIGATLTETDLPTYQIKPIWMVTLGLSLILISPFWINLFEASRLYLTGLSYEQQGNTVKAEQLYKDAISTDDSHADSYQALSRIYWKKYERTHSQIALANALEYLHQAIHCKNDVRYLNDLRRYTGLIGGSSDQRSPNRETPGGENLHLQRI